MLYGHSVIRAGQGSTALLGCWPASNSDTANWPCPLSRGSRYYIVTNKEPASESLRVTVAGPGRLSNSYPREASKRGLTRGDKSLCGLLKANLLQITPGPVVTDIYNTGDCSHRVKRHSPNQETTLSFRNTSRWQGSINTGWFPDQFRLSMLDGRVLTYSLSASAYLDIVQSRTDE
jgi:hypothetical protein